LNCGVEHADPRAIAGVAQGPSGPWRRRWSTLVLAVILPCAVATVGLVWLEVAKTLRKPDPVFVPKPPVVSGVVWSNRVFVDRAALRRWLAARHLSLEAWERTHPAAARLLRARDAR
jgi:hypothetical protein